MIGKPGAYTPVRRASDLQQLACMNSYAFQRALNDQAMAGLASVPYGGGNLADLMRNAAPQIPERVNSNGQTRRQWIAGLRARTAMMEMSGIPMSASEMAVWEAEAAEWK
ncbi:hypothetical protein O6V14_04665 [Sphingomonas faeni]|uniref:hypothetical protein n=1 Tax=Sphingomonas faeni TaxID=185950 RepID=UPI0033527BA2